MHIAECTHINYSLTTTKIQSMHIAECTHINYSLTITKIQSMRDVVVVATVSCIYGLGTPQEYIDRMVRLKIGDSIDRNQLLRKFVDIQYKRNDMAFERGTFRVRGDTI